MRGLALAERPRLVLLLGCLLSACSAASLEPTCARGQLPCGNVCKNLQADPENCGGCNQPCQSEDSCYLGRCVPIRPSCSDRLLVTESGRFDLDLTVVVFQGRLTKNRQRVPDDLRSRGYLRLIGRDGISVDLPKFSATGEASYSAKVFAGLYDVVYAPSPDCQPGGALPCQSLLLQKKLAIVKSDAFDFDVTTVRAHGQLTEYGKPPAEDAAGRGYIVFADGNTGEVWHPMPAVSGKATYQGEMFPGTYDAYYQPGERCHPDGALPCQSVRLGKALELLLDRELDFDVATVQITGRMTRNGARVPDDTKERGYLSFVTTIAGESKMPWFGSTGEARYAGKLFSGDYDVYYWPSDVCDINSALPCQVAQVGAAIPVHADGQVDFDAKIVRATGKLTKNGKSEPAVADTGGRLAFRRQDGIVLSSYFAKMGEVTYQAQVFAGTYDVYFYPYAFCNQGPALPCQFALLRSQVPLTTDATLDVDLKTAKVMGQLTKNGASLASDNLSRGAIEFRSDRGSLFDLPGLSPAGDATYSGEIFQGTYSIFYRPDRLCKGGGALPCQRLPMQDGVAISGDGQWSFDLHTARLSGTLTIQGDRPPDDERSRGVLEFVDDQGNSKMTPQFSATGEATYRDEIFQGAYRVFYRPDPLCQRGGALPCQTLLVKGCP